MKNLNRKKRIAKLLEINGIKKNKNTKIATSLYFPALFFKWIWDNVIEDEAWAPTSQEDIERAEKSARKRIHEQLNILGLIPVVGSIPLIANAILYHYDGDDYNAAFCLLAAVLAMLGASGEIQLIRGILPPSYSQTILKTVWRLADNLPFGANAIMENTIKILTNTYVEKILEQANTLLNTYGTDPIGILATRAIRSGVTKSTSQSIRDNQRDSETSPEVLSSGVRRRF